MSRATRRHARRWQRNPPTTRTWLMLGGAAAAAWWLNQQGLLSIGQAGGPTSGPWMAAIQTGPGGRVPVLWPPRCQPYGIGIAWQAGGPPPNDTNGIHWYAGNPKPSDCP
jgi:hypothetical protein